jgi:hypothetical protein
VYGKVRTLEAATGLARRRRVATSPLAACMKSAQPLSAFTTLQEFLPSPSLLLVRERLFMNQLDWAAMSSRFHSSQLMFSESTIQIRSYPHIALSIS